MIKKSLLVAALALLGCVSKAQAYTEVYDKGFSTAAVMGVHCSSGATAVNITQTLSGFKLAGYRVNNTHASAAIYLGYNSSVSTDTASNFLGAPIAAGGSGVFLLGYNPDINANLSLWCKAADAATSGARPALEVFGIK